MRTAVEITLITASSMVPSVSTDLPKSRHEQSRTQHMLSVGMEMALPVWLPPEKWTAILSAGMRHRVHGRLPRFR